MNVQNISLSAVRQLQLELDRYEVLAKRETQDQQTRSLGLLRMDLVTECRRRLLFFSFMVKDAGNHSNQRRRSARRTPTR
jgi:hypothetical protein